MLKNSLYARIVACAAGVAMMVPAMPVQAAPKAAQQIRQGTDVVLVSGTVSGKLLNANGKPVEGAVVTVAKNGKEVGKTVTKTDGSYTVSGLTSGTHTISLADLKLPVRLWSQNTAPASAKTQFTVAQTTVRGQGFDPTTGEILGGAALLVGAVALGIAIHAHDEANYNKPVSP